jgi:hypothetical protein
LPIGTKIDAEFSVLFNDGILKNAYVVKQLDACIGSGEAILNLFRAAAGKAILCDK